jgi:hypothetical protein
MVETNGKEDQWKAAFTLKGTSIGGKQGLWKKAMSCRWLTTEEGLPKVLQAVGQVTKGLTRLEKEGH